MTIHRACQDIDATRVNEEMGTGLAVGFVFKTVDSYSPELCVDSAVSEDDAIAKLEQVVQGYCAQKGTQTCSQVSPIRVQTVGKMKLWFENLLGYLFSFKAENM